jgi:type II secretory pathway component PulJ
MKNNNKGFSVVEVVIGIFIIAAVAGSAWLVLSRRQNNKSDTSATQSSQNQVSDKAISNENDLKNSAAELNSTDIDSQLDTTDVDQALAQ